MSEDFDFELARALRKQVSSDESIHSVLLRRLLSYEPNVKPIGIISNNGKWIDEPFIHRGYEHLFYRYPDHLLLEMIDMGISVNGNNNSLFDNPAYYTYRIKSTFFSGERRGVRKNTGRKIRYCLCCIKESIELVGYGYFRHFWELSHVCLIHGQQLKELPELGFSKTLKAVKKLLNAKECKQATPVRSVKQLKKKSSSQQLWDETGKYVFPIKLAPGCMMQVFANWVYENKSKFENTMLRDFSHRVIKQYIHFYSDAHYEFDFRRDFSCIFMLCAEFEPDLLNVFMESSVSFIGLELGPRKQGILREVMAKHSMSDCNTCEDQHCIMKEHKDTFDIKETQLSIEKLFEHSYTLSRIAMQGRPIGRNKYSRWGVIDVLPDMSGEKNSESIVLQLKEVYR